MGVTRHRYLTVRVTHGLNPFTNNRHRVAQLLDGRANPKCEISGDLVVTTATGVQLVGDGSYTLAKERLHSHVHIFLVLWQRRSAG